MKILLIIFDYILNFRILRCINAEQNLIKIKANVKIKLPGNIMHSWV